MTSMNLFGRKSKGREPGESVDLASEPPDAAAQLIVVVVSAAGIAAADKGGTSDPYAKIYVKEPGKPPREESTKEVKKTLSPTWNARFAFDDVKDPQTEVVIQIKDWDPVSMSNLQGKSTTLGQVSVKLCDLFPADTIPADGTMLDQERELVTATEGSPSRTLPPQGRVRFLVGWLPPPEAAASSTTGSTASARGSDSEPSKRNEMSARNQVVSLPDSGAEWQMVGAAAAGASADSPVVVPPSGGEPTPPPPVPAASAPAAEGLSAPAAEAAAEPPAAVDGFEPPTKQGQLRVALLRARGLAAADKGGTSDPYARLIVRSGGKTLKTEGDKPLTKVIKKTVDPEWVEMKVVDGVDVTARVSIVILDEDKGMFSLGKTFDTDADDPLGQVGSPPPCHPATPPPKAEPPPKVLARFHTRAPRAICSNLADTLHAQADFSIRDLTSRHGLSPDGHWLKLDSSTHPSLMTLQPVSEGTFNQKRPAQGTLEIMVAWVAPPVAAASPPAEASKKSMFGALASPFSSKVIGLHTLRTAEDSEDR